MKRVIIIFVILISSCLFQFCDKEKSGDIVIFGFENDFDLDRLNWKCHSLFSISDGYSSEGLKSLKVELYPSKYPGVSFRDYRKNWDGFQKLCFEIYNPEKKTTEIVIRIDDSPDNTDYADRYNKRLVLLPGINNITIPLSTLRTSGGGKKLNLKTICKFLLFAAGPKQKIEFYIDNLRLEK